MSLLLNTPPELEQRLHDEAARAGMDTPSYALSLLAQSIPPFPRLPALC